MKTGEKMRKKRKDVMESRTTKMRERAERPMTRILG